MKTIILGYAATAVLCLMAQAPNIDQFSSWIQYGALGLLGLTVLGQLYIIVISQRDAFQRMDVWEKQRHEDSVMLNETLTRLRENCAATIPHKPR